MLAYFPTSSYSQISFLIEIIVQLRPAKILDVGAGGGKYGLLCNECLMDVPREQAQPLQIDAVEAFDPYITDVHKTVYTRIMRGDIRELAAGLDSYDLVMMIDMFEHIPKADGVKLMQSLRSRAKHILVSVPAREHYQAAFDGNEYEVHHAQYTNWRELRDLGFNQIWRIGGNWIALSSDQPVHLRARILRTAFSALLPLDVARVIAIPFSYLRKRLFR
jgi:hypothetical protein